MQTDRTEVVITDVQIPFMSMVVLIIKWTIAAIPAILILWALGALAAGLFIGMFGGMDGF